MPDVRINVSVDPTFDELAKRFGSVEVERVLQGVIEKAAFETERLSKTEAPVDTGRLRSSISTDIGNLRAQIAPHVDYAIFVHEGTKFMKPRPFMKRGWELAETRLFGSLNILKSELEREFRDKLR